MTAALMLQGTGSDVGKSLIAAGLCRAFTRRGLKVRPFKPQNMSNNAAVTADGGEIGRAQAVQARACGVEPVCDMNPVLLKPESETGAQVIVRGRRLASLAARAYGQRRQAFLPAVLESFARLSADADLVIVEGAGSPAEINLRAGDIANMGFAAAANVPVVLIGDIHRGGVIASIIGTFAVLADADAALIRAFLVNKFHGDPALFADGAACLVQRTGRPCVGVVPHFEAAGRLPAEDALALDSRAATGAGPLHIAVPRVSRIANFDDLDPLRLEPSVRLTLVRPGEAIPGDAGLVLLPGSKTTIADLAFLRAQGWDIDILAHVRRGGRVLGLCGGYQMLGRAVRDPDGVEGGGAALGLGLLDVETVLAGTKSLHRVSGTHCASGAPLAGYEMHMGRTGGPDCDRPFARVGEGEGEGEGATSADGRVAGTYLHGLFGSDAFRAAFLAGLGASSAGLAYEAGVEDTLDALAGHLEEHCDLDLLWRIARERGGPA